ncbi:RteC domain-containing protein [Wenyingzhuangia sp. 1_MG-2023]|nr:RteC domain-containing protein [Wenyingzhuangia sp. 1_MG-2023]
MKNITKLMDGYHALLKKIESKNLAKHKQLKHKIQASKRYSHQIRVYVRDMKFKDLNEEITFFKIIKPKITADIKLYNHQLAYHQEKPFISLEKQKKYIQKKLRELEVKKKKHLKFYRYMRLEETAYDELYFSREKERLELFPFSDFNDTDFDFTTSHDQLACEVKTYDVLCEFYKQELHCISNVEAGFYDTSSNRKATNNHLLWTATKTDLVELIYALKVTGAINGGETQVKELMESFGDVFNIDLINYYKTYTEIRNRNSNQIKFLSKLSINLKNKLEHDDKNT